MRPRLRLGFRDLDWKLSRRSDQHSNLAAPAAGAPGSRASESCPAPMKIARGRRNPTMNWSHEWYCTPPLIGRTAWSNGLLEGEAQQPQATKPWSTTALRGQCSHTFETLKLADSQTPRVADSQTLRLPDSGPGISAGRPDRHRSKGAQHLSRIAADSKAIITVFNKLMIPNKEN